MTTTGQKLIFQAALTSVPEQRQSILAKLSTGDIEVGFEAIDNLLKQANISQRPLLLDLANRFIELGAETRLVNHLMKLLVDEELQVRNVSWLLCRLDVSFEVAHIDRILSSNDPDVILPYLFKVIDDDAWSDLLTALATEHPSHRVQLWTQYFIDYLAGKDRNSPPFYLLELDNLGDPHVDPWISKQLAEGYYDANILSVCCDREDSKYFQDLWERIWERPKHKDLAVRTLTVTAAHLRAPIPQLFAEADQSDDPEERKQIAKRLAQTCSNKVFQQAKALCNDEAIAKRELGVMILSYFGSPWHPARPECVKLVLEALNDEEHDIRARAADGLLATERDRMEKAATNLAPDEVTEGGVKEAWDILLEEPLNEYEGSREDLHDAFADRLPAKKPPPKVAERPVDEHGYRKSSETKKSGKTKPPPPNRKPLLIAISVVLTLTLGGLLTYGLWPREVEMVPGVMTAQALTPQVKVEVEEEKDDSQDLADENIGDAVEGRRAAQLSATMKQPHDKLMLERSECWYLYHRMSPVDSGQYVAKGPTPSSPDDPTWELYTTHLLKFIGDEISKGIFNRVGEFLMTIAALNPPLANQLILKTLSETGTFDRDDFAAGLVQGGAIDLPSLMVHPALPSLSPSVRAALMSELLSGWKTDEELALANYLNSMK